MKTLSLLIILAVCGSASWCSDEEHYRLRQTSSRQRQPHTKKETTRESSASIRSRDDSEICGSSTLKRLASMTSNASVWSAVGPISLPGGGTITNTSAQLPPAHPADAAPQPPASPYSLEEVQALRRQSCNWDITLEERLTAAEKWFAGSPEVFEYYQALLTQADAILAQPYELARNSYIMRAQALLKERNTVAAAVPLAPAASRLTCLANAAWEQEVGAFVDDMVYDGGFLELPRALGARVLLDQAIIEETGRCFAHSEFDLNFRNFYEAYHARK